MIECRESKSTEDYVRKTKMGTNKTKTNRKLINRKIHKKKLKR